MRATEIATEFANALTQKFVNDERYVRSSRHISVIPGNRFDKLVSGTREGEHGTALEKADPYGSFLVG